MTTETTNQESLSRALRTALRRLPGPVSLVTSYDPTDGTPAGIVASAVIPVSLEPPSMLVAVNRHASLHRIIVSSGRFCINLLGVAQTAFVPLFSDGAMRTRRFESPEWQFAERVPWLPAACANIFCRVDETLVFGTHELVIGTVHDVKSDPERASDPLGWLEGNFAQLDRLR